MSIKPGAGARILVVDDDASTRSGMARLLASEGHTVELASDAQAALALAAANAPDVVVADLMMPGMDGMELVQKLHERDPHLAVIVATGHWDLAAAVRAMHMGAADYIAKPVDFSALTTLIDRALARRKIRIDAERLHPQPCELAR